MKTGVTTDYIFTLQAPSTLKNEDLLIISKPLEVTYPSIIICGGLNNKM